MHTLHRGDFGRWIGDVFGDHVLAKELEAQERRYVLEKNAGVLDHIVAAIRSRYDLAEDTNDTGTATSLSAVR